ncbi:GNAT family protein [Enterovibrio sp. Hal110]
MTYSSMTYSNVTFPNIAFQTPRLTAAALSSSALPHAKSTLSTELATLLTSNVKRHLPPDLQAVSDTESALCWLEQTLEDCQFVALRLADDDALVGFFLLYVEVNAQRGGQPRLASPHYSLRLGYVVAETFQGQGLASEMVEGLITWCQTSGVVSSLSGGAEADNLPSIKVLEKNGFVRERNDEFHQGNTVFLTLML